MAQLIVFCVLALVIVGCSLMAVTSRLIIRSATYLLFVLLATAGLYLMMDYQFLAAVQVAVYAGGVMVLFIFSILLTNRPGEDVQFEKPKRMILAAVAALAGLGICGHIIYYNVNRVYVYMESNLDMTQLGTAMMGTDKYQYLLPFEAISLLLLACIIGGIMIARKR
ncbi:NADH-quinone oxidoreductase subunit J family protein [Dysgonomonas macrotermitis]|uniref:NADH-quinone oxidoreductase subunit J n=1 Tax=Dysgonomonas macrotermitis TaxID=1346286 RepID=A0A1M5DE13_9BACT|nr:NADH-quinone oxidoreductase subunit J [Dysgonomonas macrotermitis]SHF65239.1 NADH-quinone oxidoreductase subunit J [Dysgonomonas macrotermitis]